MIIKVKVKANSGKQEIIKDNGNYIAYLKSAPENNKANIELLKLIGKHFKKTARIKTGIRGRNKTIEVK